MINLGKFSREQRALIAKDWNENINNHYADVIKECISKTERYGRNSAATQVTGAPSKNKPNIGVRILPVDSVTCLFEGLEAPWMPQRKVAILNFASFKNPGGMFLEGSPAQEESLCHQSILYPILEGFKEEYYEKHKKILNRALYITDILYTPDVMFFDQIVTMDKKDKIQRKLNTKIMRADVITCAAPNVGTYLKFCNGHTDDVDAKTGRNVIEQQLFTRIRSILMVAKSHNVEDLILGAYGCGVFRCDPDMVSKIFFRLLKDSRVSGGSFKTVYFPIPISKYDKNFDTFWRNWEQNN